MNREAMKAYRSFFAGKRAVPNQFYAQIAEHMWNAATDRAAGVVVTWRHLEAPLSTYSLLHDIESAIRSGAEKGGSE